MHVRRLLLWAAGWAVLLGLLPLAVQAQSGGPVTPSQDSQIAVETTGPTLCTTVIVQEPAGAAGEAIALQALPLVAGEGAPVQPVLSLAGCNDPQAADRLSFSLAPNAWQVVYLRADLPQVATYSGRLIIQQGGGAAAFYQLSATRQPRELQVSPLTGGQVALATHQSQFRQPLRVALQAGHAAIGNLTYQVVLARTDGGGLAEAWLEQGGQRITAPLALADGAPLSLDLVGTLPDVAGYGGQLTFFYDGEEQAVPLAVTREATELSIAGPGVDGGSVTLVTKLGEFESPVRVALPAGTDPVQRLAYTAHLARSDGAGEREPPQIRLLSDQGDLNEVPLSLQPGAEAVELAVAGTLPEATGYAGYLLLDLGEGRTQTLTLALTRQSFAPGEGLAMPTPAPPRWQTGPLVVPGAHGTVSFDLQETAGQAVPLYAPELVALVQVQEDGSVVNNWLGRKPALVLPDGEFTLPAFGSQAVELDLGQLTSAGRYQATVRVAAPDGRRIDSTALILVRHHWFPALIALVVGIAVAWLVQFWAGGGRELAVARWKVAQAHDEIARDGEEQAVLPDWIAATGAARVLQAVADRLDRQVIQAQMAHTTPQLLAAAEEATVRAGFLREGLRLARAIDAEMDRQQLPDPERDALEKQVHAWLANTGMLYDRLEQFDALDAVQDAETGAPPLLAHLRQRLIDLEHGPYQALLDDLKGKLEKLQALDGDGTALQALADQARRAIQDNLVGGAAVQLQGGNLERAGQYLDRARAAYAWLLADGLELQLSALEATRPAGTLSGPWTAAAQAIDQAQSVLAAIPADAPPDARLAAVQQALLPFTQAQVWVSQAQLERTPLDLAPAEWQRLAGYDTLAGALAQAEQALATAAAPPSPAAGTPSLAAGQRLYEQAARAWPWLQLDLLAFRLERLADGAPGQMPPGVRPDDADWARVRALAEIEAGDLPDKVALTEAALARATARGLRPLLQHLALAEARAPDACDAPAELAELRHRLRLATDRHARLLQALVAPEAGATAHLAAAEQAYQEAYDAYAVLRARCVAPPKGEALEAARLPEHAERPVATGPAFGPEDAALVATPVARERGGIAAAPVPAGPLWRHLVGVVDGAAVAVAFVVAVGVGLATKVLAQPTFGSFGDYLTVALWGFGVGELSQFLTQATYGEVLKKVKGG